MPITSRRRRRRRILRRKLLRLRRPKRARPAEKKELCLYEALGAERRSGGVGGGKSRCLSLFHRRVLAMDPERFRENRDHEDYEKFKFLCLALCVLVDDGRREVYDKHGLSGLARSEKYSQVDVFDVDPLQVFDNFFDCKNMSGSFDEDIKQYLLFEAGGGGDDDDDERVDVPAYAGREKRPRIRSDAIEPPPNPPPSIGTAAALMMKRSLLSSYSSEKGGGDVWTKLVSAHPNNNT